MREDTSCHKVRDLSRQLIPKLTGVLDSRTLDALRSELERLGNADGDILQNMRGFLEALDTQSEALHARIVAGDVQGALALKQEFEAQISPTFRRSKAVLEEMNRSVGAVRGL